MLFSRTLITAAVATAALAATATPALAGPPFICHAFELSGNPSLPWGPKLNEGWKNPDPTYDLKRLTADVTTLLASPMPVSARMETLRRATIYAAKDHAVASSLLAALEAKAKANPQDAFALFDAGFLTEAYRQASRVYAWDMLEGREKGEWTMRTEPVGNGATLIDAAVALNTTAAPEMRKARLMLR